MLDKNCITQNGLFPQLYKELFDMIQVLEKTHGLSRTDALANDEVFNFLDQILCLEVISEGCFKTEELIDKLNMIFKKTSDSKDAIIFTTVHRAKGKEYTYVLLPFADDPITMKSYPGNDDIVINADGIGYSISLKNENGLSTQISNSFYEQIKSTENADKSYEEARILYVAVTRAKRGIAYIKNASKKGKAIIRWQDVLEVKNDGE